MSYIIYIYIAAHYYANEQYIHQRDRNDIRNSVNKRIVSGWLTDTFP